MVLEKGYFGLRRIKNMKNFINFFAISIMSLVFFIGCGKQKGDVEFIKAINAIKKGDYVRSRSLLEKSLRKTVSSDKKAIIANELGLTLWKMGDYESSGQYFKQAVDYSTNFNASAFNYSLSLFYDEKIDDAEILLNNFLSDNPNNNEAKVLLGCIAFKNQEWDLAHDIISSCLSEDKTNPRLKNIWVITKLFKDNDLTQSKGDFDLIVALHPEYLPARFNLAGLYDKYINDSDSALIHYNYYAENTFSDLPFHNLALDFIDKINNGKKEVKIILTPQEIESLIRKGNSENRNKNYSEAINILEKVIKSDPNIKTAHYQIGMSYFYLNRYNAAKDSFLSALRIDSNYANAIYMLAASYIQMRDYDQAEKEALKLVKIKKNDGDIILDLIKKGREK
tara:strand:- start:4575 stop:5759 length:1185 start_codon:yes stop_codon:yes gene_type:complete